MSLITYTLSAFSPEDDAVTICPSAVIEEPTTLERDKPITTEVVSAGTV
jgi:hypothetical protein